MGSDQMRLEDIARSAIEGIERELGISIIWGVVPDVANSKYHLQVAGGRVLEFEINPAASDTAIAAEIRARLLAHFR